VKFEAAQVSQVGSNFLYYINFFLYIYKKDPYLLVTPVTAAGFIG
jgi:hypothetical protein